MRRHEIQTLAFLGFVFLFSMAIGLHCMALTVSSAHRVCQQPKEDGWGVVLPVGASF